MKFPLYWINQFTYLIGQAAYQEHLQTTVGRFTGLYQ